jgi:hypothetical protein
MVVIILMAFIVAITALTLKVASTDGDLGFEQIQLHLTNRGHTETNDTYLF